MTGSEEVGVFEGALPQDGGGASASSAPQEDVPGPRRRVLASLAAIFAVLVVAVGIVFGIWAYAAVHVPASVPAIVSLTPKAAEAALADAHLASGKATFVVTREFPSGSIISQSPAPYTRVRQGTAVNVRIAVAPKPITVPDVVTLESGRALALLRYQQLVPTVIRAYSKDVQTGLVIEQLPRAGDTAMTGSAEVVVVSLGPGTPGAVIPALVGKKFATAHAIAASATLFAQTRPVIAKGAAVGTVVDQVPSAGTIVDVAANVWLAVATSSSAP